MPVMAAWADNDVDPATAPVIGFIGTGYRFRCPAGHHPRLAPLTFLPGCPSCAAIASRTAEAAEAAEFDEPRMSAEIATQWHPIRNGTIDPRPIPPMSRRKFWWSVEACEYEWEASLAGRETGRRLRCPRCETILDSLGHHNPELAAEWPPANQLRESSVRPLKPGSSRCGPVAATLTTSGLHRCLPAMPGPAARSAATNSAYCPCGPAHPKNTAAARGCGWSARTCLRGHRAGPQVLPTNC